MNPHHSVKPALLALLAICAVGCDRRDAPMVDGDSKAVSSPPGEIVDPGPEASAQADRMPRLRTPDRPTCPEDGPVACNGDERALDASERARDSPAAPRRDP